MRESTIDAVRGHFGRIDIELAERIGLIAMLGSLIEDRVAAVAMSLANGPQATYARAPFGSNVKTIRRRLPKFDQDRFVVYSTARILTALDAVSVALQERHQLVHRVWAQPTREPWGGHKVESVLSGAEYKWRDFDADALDTTIDGLASALHLIHETVGLATAFPRLED